MSRSNTFLCFILALALVSCASPQKSELAAGENLEAAVAEVTELSRQAERAQADLLSFEQHNKASSHLQKARRGLSGGYEKEYVLNNAAIAKAQFEEALDLARTRASNATRILQSRRASLDAGLRNSDDLLNVLARVDDDLRDETDDFSRSLEPKEFSEFQKQYFSLEIRAVQFRELDAVNQTIQKATADDAKDLAPNTLRTAMLNVSEAENLIAQSPRAPATHRDSVNEAVKSAALLSDVMNVILNAKGTPEDIALKIVYQNRELEKLSKNVGSLEQNLKTTQSSLVDKDVELKKQTEALQSTKSTLLETEGALILQNEELEKTSTQVRFQKAMDEAVRQFSDDEASVYQQGSKLIFRLKSINFPSGTATIPAASKPLLGKVNDIIKSIGAEIVAVQGHTDSVGADDLNQKLSTRRAVSVANYLASLAGGYKIGYIGYGESKPIASNETQEGRAINRRVDLVVTAKK